MMNGDPYPPGDQRPITEQYRGLAEEENTLILWVTSEEDEIPIALAGGKRLRKLEVGYSLRSSSNSSRSSRPRLDRQE